MELQRYHDWIRHFSSDHRLLYAGHLLARAASLFPQKTALIVENEQCSFAQLFAQAQQMSNYLLMRGLQPADRVILLIENSSFFYSAYYGAWQIGAIVAPVSTFLTSQELAHIINDAQPRYIITSDALRSKLPDTIPAKLLIQFSDVREQLAQQPETAPPLHALPAQETCIILYTSGTTGKPKGVMLNSQGIMSNLCQSLARFNFVGSERIFCPLPLFHSFTQSICLWMSIATGSTIILLAKISRKNLIEAAQQQPTIVLGIPHLYALLCYIPGLSFDCVRYFVCGGEALAPNIRRAFALRFGRMLVNGYGLTEAGPVISIELGDYIQPTHTIGKPLVDIQYQLRNKDGIYGTLWVSGPNMMNGYFHASQATEKVLQDGWLNTGDIVTCTEQGALIIAGREKDIIVNKGIKIYPQEIETVLNTHPLIALSAVVAAQDPQDGEYPIAYVQLISYDPSCSAEIFRAYCAERLAAYKVPRKVVIVKELALTATGKIDKKQLRSL